LLGLYLIPIFFLIMFYFTIIKVSIDSLFVCWRIPVQRFNLQTSRSKEARSAMRWIGSRDRAVSQLTNTKAAPAGVLGNGNGFRCLSLLPADAFIPCDSISVSPFAPAKSNLPVVSWPTRAHHRNESRVDFHSFLNSRKWSRRFYPRRRKPLCPRHLFYVPFRTNLRLSPARARWSNFQEKLKNCHEQIGSCARAPKLVNPVQKRYL